LWTEIYSSDRALHFEAAAAAPLRLVAPALGQAAPARILLRFAQGAAVLVGEPNQTVSVIDRASAPSNPGGLTAVIGT
jgi:hypothetical protein